MNKPAQYLSEVNCLFVTVLCSQWNINVQTGKSRSFGEARYPELFQKFMHSVSRLNYFIKTDPVRIKVNHKIVRIIQITYSGMPGMNFNGAEIRHVNQTLRILP